MDICEYLILLVTQHYEIYLKHKKHNFGKIKKSANRSNHNHQCKRKRGL